MKPTESPDTPEAEAARDEVSPGPSVAFLTLAWPLLHAASTDDGLLVSIAVGLGGGFLMALVSSFAAGLFESVVGHRRAASAGFVAVAGAAAVAWWQMMPAWSAGIMSALAVVGLVSIARRESRLSRQPRARVELPDAAQAELDALPATLGAGLAEARDAVVASYLAVERAAAELGDEALVDARALRADALGTLVAALRQIRRVHDAGEGGGVAEVEARGRARLDRLAGALAETRARLLTFLQMRDEGETPDLAAHASQLRHAAVGLRELNELER